MSADGNRRAPKVLAISSPKGGVGKTTTAVNLAHLATLEGYRVFLVDADPNLSATEWVDSAGERMTFDIEAVDKVQEGSLARLRELDGFDLVVVDLPGAKESSAWGVLRRGTGGVPAFDAVLVTSGVNTMDLRPVTREIDTNLSAADVPYLLVGVRVKTPSVPQAATDLAEIAGAGFNVARTMIRELTVHTDSVREARPITDMPGGNHSTARAAEREYRSLAREVFAGLLEMKWSESEFLSEPKKGKK